MVKPRRFILTHDKTSLVANRIFSPLDLYNQCSGGINQNKLNLLMNFLNLNTFLLINGFDCIFSLLSNSCMILVFLISIVSLHSLNYSNCLILVHVFNMYEILKLVQLKTTTFMIILRYN